MNNSIVDYLNSKKQDSSYSARASLAKKFGNDKYAGTASDNLDLLSKLQKQDSMGARAVTPNTLNISNVLPANQQAKAISSTPAFDPAKSPQLSYKDSSGTTYSNAGNKAFTPSQLGMTPAVPNVAGFTTSGSLAGLPGAPATPSVGLKNTSGAPSAPVSAPSTTPPAPIPTSTPASTGTFVNPAPASPAPVAPPTPPAPVATNPAPTSLAQYSNPQIPLIQALLQQAQMTPQEMQARQALAGQADNQAQDLSRVFQHSIPLSDQTGRAQVMNNMYAQRAGALGSLIDAFAQQRGVATNALGTAVGATAPIQVSPGTNVMSPQTGQQIGQGGFKSLTDLAIANTNIDQGQVFQQQAGQLNASLTQAENALQSLQSLARSAGINLSDYPDMNSLQQAVMSRIGNPGAMNAFNSILAEFKNLSAQIYGASGAQTPTEIDSLINTTDPGRLSPAQMQVVFDTLKQQGGNRIAVLQQNANQAYNANAGQSPSTYYGAPASVNTGAPTIPGLTPAGQAGANLLNENFGGLINMLFSGNKIPLNAMPTSTLFNK